MMPETCHCVVCTQSFPEGLKARNWTIYLFWCCSIRTSSTTPYHKHHILRTYKLSHRDTQFQKMSFRLASTSKLWLFSNRISKLSFCGRLNLVCRNGRYPYQLQWLNEKKTRLCIFQLLSTGNVYPAWLIPLQGHCIHCPRVGWHAFYSNWF